METRSKENHFKVNPSSFIWIFSVFSCRCLPLISELHSRTALIYIAFCFESNLFCWCCCAQQKETVAISAYAGFREQPWTWGRWDFIFKQSFLNLRTNSNPSSHILRSSCSPFTFLHSSIYPLLREVRASQRESTKSDVSNWGIPKLSSLYLDSARYTSKKNGLQKASTGWGINPGPTRSDLTDYPSHTTVIHIHRT